MNGDFFVVFYIVKRINNIIKRKRGTSFLNFLFFCDPLGARTRDPNIKSVVLYQLS